MRRRKVHHIEYVHCQPGPPGPCEPCRGLAVIERAGAWAGYENTLVRIDRTIPTTAEWPV
ncbi:MAG: hypothetical protein ACLQNE_27180 [Thermoguttaceae bacterium]